MAQGLHRSYNDCLKEKDTSYKRRLWNCRQTEYWMNELRELVRPETFGPTLVGLPGSRTNQQHTNIKTLHNYLTQERQAEENVQNISKCWNKGRLYWKIAKLFYLCHLEVGQAGNFLTHPRINVTLRSVRATVVSVENQWVLHILSVCF